MGGQSLPDEFNGEKAICLIKDKLGAASGRNQNE
jgi:hypothetical protein